MCGRYTLRTAPQEIAVQFELLAPPPIGPRFNIAPSQQVGAVTAQLEAEGRVVRHWREFSWGLLPGWAESSAGTQRPINARSETAASKPTFREAFRRRRCLIPADGFYEWQATGREKQPYYFSLRDRPLFAFAGLYEHWESAPGKDAAEVIDTCTILTTEANELMREFHDRMPVILEPGDYAAWLDPRCEDADAVLALCRPLPSERLQHRAVSPRVNSPKHDDEACLRRSEVRRLFD